MFKAILSVYFFTLNGLYLTFPYNMYHNNCILQERWRFIGNVVYQPFCSSYFSKYYNCPYKTTIYALTLFFKILLFSFVDLFSVFVSNTSIWYMIHFYCSEQHVKKQLFKLWIWWHFNFKSLNLLLLVYSIELEYFYLILI